MPRSHINRAPYDFPYPAACRGFRDRIREPSDFHFYGMCGHIFCGAREVPGENWSSEMQGALKGADRVPVECRPVTLRAPSDEQVYRWLQEGARPGSSRRPARCTELQSESGKKSHFLKVVLFEV